MGCAVSLVARNKSAAAITKIWEEVSAFETLPSMSLLDYPPHFTFAKFDDLSAVQLKKKLGKEFLPEKPIRLTFEKLGYFDSDPMVVFAAPRQKERVQGLHHAVQSRIDAAICHPNYLPGQWVPHCALATMIDREHKQGALDYIGARKTPFDVIFNAIEITEYFPIKVVQEYRLDA